jgi:hypothetical protein
LQIELYTLSLQLYYIHKISVPTCCTAGALLNQAETCRRTNQQQIVMCNKLALNLANVEVAIKMYNVEEVDDISFGTLST